jgi:predicted RNA-binding protein with EMAP domain
MPSLPPVSAKVIADAEQFIQEFRRAEAAAGRSAAGIDREVDQLAKNIKKKFSLGDMGKDILRGAGLFGGFEIANKAAELLVGHFREAAEAAQKIEAATSEQLQLTKQIIALRQTDAQRMQTTEKEVAQARRAYEESEKRKITTKADFGFWQIDTLPTEIPRTAADRAESDRLLNEWTRLDKLHRSQIEQGKSKGIAENARELDKLADAARRAGTDMAALKEITPEDEVRAAEGLKKWNEELDNQAEAFKKLADPLRAYREQLEEIGFLASQQKLTDDEAWAAKVATWSKMADEVARNHPGVDMAAMKEVPIGEVADQVGKLSDTARELGLTFSSAFEDAVIGGNKLSDVLQGLAQDMARLFLRKAVTEPLVGQALKVFGFAGGGEPPVGVPSLVGEDGPELFVPKTAGTIVPAGRTAAMLGGGGGEIHVHQHNTFTTGVTRQELGAMLPRLVDAAKAAVADGVARGGSYRRAFA